MNTRELLLENRVLRRIVAKLQATLLNEGEQIFQRCVPSAVKMYVNNKGYDFTTRLGLKIEVKFSNVGNRGNFTWKIRHMEALRADRYILIGVGRTKYIYVFDLSIEEVRKNVKPNGVIRLHPYAWRRDARTLWLRELKVPIEDLVSRYY